MTTPTGTKRRRSSAAATVVESGRVKGGTLVIVESPTKARTLNRYLGKGYQVIASGGHVRDLPVKRIGINIDDGFKPEFVAVASQRKVISQMRKAAAEAGKVFIATDPDREGEAIAWHIASLISDRVSDGIKRVQFHEITARAVKAALESPGEINSQKVDAQLTRRIMDRLVGYQVSPILWKTVTGGLSAGRVQSVALRLICEREGEIEDFVQEEYWTIDGLFQGKGLDEFSARLHRLDGEKVQIGNDAAAERVCDRLKGAAYRVDAVKKTHKKRRPAPPFTTSTLQQDAARRLRFSVKRTMAIAQQLYEGVSLGDRGLTGLITYMRTDSTRVAAEAVDALRDWIKANYGTEYLAGKVRVYANRKGAVQDAHEAIRPTDVTLIPDKVKPHLTKEQHHLYELIWKRFVATQMKEALLDITTVTIGGGAGIEFRAAGQIMRFPGFLTVYSDSGENGQEEAAGRIPEAIAAGMELQLKSLDPQQHFTQPPPRFNEASLVKELDEKGIGRPSTYTTIISTLLDRKYVERQKRVLHPTELGRTVNNILIDRFPEIFNVSFTAKMEEELDRIETGGERLDVLRGFYNPFSQALQAALEQRDRLKREALKPVGRECPECGSELVYKWGRHGQFISCSNFPKCRYSERIEQEEPQKTDAVCPKCGAPMVVRSGRYGKFLGCSTYPKCKGILPFTTGFKCPRDGCDGEIVEKRSKKGRVFFSCSNYPKCDFSSWHSPVAGPCPDCGAPTLFQKTSKTGEVTLYCGLCKWKKTD